MPEPQPASPPKPVAATPAPDASQAMLLFVLIVATLYFGKEVLVPVTLALLLAFLLAPLVSLLRRVHLGGCRPCCWPWWWRWASSWRWAA